MSIKMDRDIFEMSGAVGPDSFKEKVTRVLWNVVYVFSFTLLPNKGFNKIRVIALRIFGAKVNFSNSIPGTVKILKPWKLIMGESSCFSDGCDIYNFDFVTLEAFTVISKNVHLCTASHNYEVTGLPLTMSPIIIGRYVWIAADCFIAPGANIGEGSVVGARSVVLADVAPWSVVGGYPAKFIKKRLIPNGKVK
jgi:putative colanic acid biosynthesis acetyltransferase WcaF